jgi:putative phage-type endonuclease
MENTRIYNIIDLEQGSQAWLDFRKYKIGASIASVIMGISPFQTPLQLWEEIMLDQAKPKNEAMKRGNRLEPKARQWFNTAYNTSYRPAVVQSIEHPDLIASLDGYIETEEGPQILEIKCPGREAHEMAINYQIPEYYYPQLQHQMYVCGAKKVNYLSYSEDFVSIREDFVSIGVVLECERDEDYIQKMVKKELEFLKSLTYFQPPEPTKNDWKELSTNKAVELARERTELKNQITKMQNKLQGIDDEIISILDHPRTKIDELKIQKVVRKGNIDYPRILDEFNLNPIAEKYRKAPSESWRFT